MLAAVFVFGVRPPQVRVKKVGDNLEVEAIRVGRALCEPAIRERIKQVAHSRARCLQVITKVGLRRTEYGPQLSSGPKGLKGQVLPTRETAATLI